MATSQHAPPPAAQPTSATDVPRLATDVELIGRYEDSGFKEAPYIARRSDGQVVQLAPMLFALAEEIDGRRTTAEIAEALSNRIQRGVDAGMVEMLLDEQLRRLGLVAMRDGDTAEVQKLDPLLALKFRAKVVPAGMVRAVTTILRPLFWPPLVVAVAAGLVALDVWLFGIHGISQSLRQVIYQPSLMFLILGGVVVATAFHEFGHATAVRYGGAEPGVMGAGVYIVWPAFYTDITDAYRLGKWGRLRADMGGMYFNAIFALAVTGAYAVTGFEPLLLLVVLQNFAIIQQSLPFLRLDGYYIVSDLTGVPDMFSRIRPVLSSLLPWRKADDRVTELRPWVRVVVTAYVITVIPVLALIFAVVLLHAPRMFATAWDSLNVRWDRLGDESTAATVKDAFQMIVLTLPCLGLVYTTTRIGHSAGRGAWRWSAGSRMRRAPLLLGTATALAFVVLSWWPRENYRPIERDERGTLVGGVRSLPRAAENVAPSLPAPQRERPAERQAPDRPSREEQAPAATVTTETAPEAEVEADPTATTPADVPAEETVVEPSDPAETPVEPTAPDDPTATVPPDPAATPP